MKLHPEILSRGQSRVLVHLGPAMSALSFYLAGGTALAIQLGHRRSVDFDWFTEQELGDPLRLARRIQEARVAFVVRAAERGTLHGTVSGVRVSCLEYRYPLLAPPVIWPDYAVPLASLEDIACMKLAAVAQRGSRKDFVDVDVLSRRMTLARMLDLYSRKYGVRDIGHVLFALTYFDDAERERMPVLLRPLDWAAVKRKLQREVAAIAG